MTSTRRRHEDNGGKYRHTLDLVEQPHNVDAEMSVLGCLLLGGPAVGEILTLLRPDAFYRGAHREIYSAVLELFNKRAEIDGISVAEELRQRGTLAEVGGQVYLVTLAEAVPSSASAAWHAKIVREKAQLRGLIAAGSELARKAGNGYPAADLLAEHLRDVAQLDGRQAKPLPALVADTPSSVLARWRTEGFLVHEPTGIVQLDEMTGGGLVYGSRVYLLGAPDAGKTALLVQIADVYLRRGVAVGLLGVDAEPGDLLQRLLQRRDWSRRACERRAPMDLDAMAEKTGTLPLRFYDTRWNIDSAGEDLARYARELGTRAVLGIDSIQTATCAAELDTHSRYENVTARVQAVRSLADRHRMLVIPTSEMSRGAYRQADPKDRTSDLAAAKESGAIEYSARVLLALRSVEGNSDLVELRVAKNKYGPSTRDDQPGIHLRLDHARQVLAEVQDYKAPTAAARADGKVAQRDKQTLEDAARLAVVLAEQPGVGARKCEELMTARTPGRMGHGRYAAARGTLAAALVELPGIRTGVRLFVTGDLVPADVLAAVPIGQRPMVAAARPPADEAPSGPTRPEAPRGAPSWPRAPEAPPHGETRTRPSIEGGGASCGAGVDAPVSEVPQHQEHGGTSTPDTSVEIPSTLDAAEQAGDQP